MSTMSRRSSLAHEESLSNINELVQKFEKISSSIHLDLQKNSLQLMENESNNIRYREDPLTNLKNMENKSEINRAEVQLMSLRKPKRYSFRTHRQKQQQKKESYISLYNKIKHEQPFRQASENDYNEQESNSEANEIVGEFPPNIKHLNHLRNHPKILQYTLQKLQSKNQINRQVVHKEQLKEQFKKASVHLSDYNDLIQSTRKSFKEDLQNSRVLIENQLTKFYTKSSKGQLDTKIKENPRCYQMLQRQKRIVWSVEETHLSKQHVKKLKQKMNQIVNEISRSDRKSAEKLPKLQKIKKVQTQISAK